MKALVVGILAASLTGGTALAKDNPSGQALGHLRQALAAAAASTTSQGPPPPEHFNPKTSNGQGAAHANPGAIAKVCSKDTPAAQRAAICQVGVSPE